MDLTPEQLEKIKNFIWNDDEEDENAQPQPEMTVCDEMLDCVDKVAEYVIENIDLLDLKQDVYSVDVPIEIHPLLSARFDRRWTEYSRSRVFDCLRAVFIQKMSDLGYVDRLEDRIREVFPQKDAMIRIGSIDFFDEPEVDVSITEKELNLTNNQEEIKETRSYNFSGNSITVELKIEILPEGFTPDVVV